MPTRAGVPNYYATNLLFDDQGRCILLGWLRGFPIGHGWNGCMALPRILTIDADGRPRQRPVPELTQLRDRLHQVSDLTLVGTPYLLADVADDVLEIKVKVRMGEARQVTVQLRRAAEGDRAVEVSYDGQMLRVAGTEVALALAQSDLDLQIFLDKSVLEVFAQDGQVAVTRVIDAPASDQGLALVAEGGPVQVTLLQIWTLKPIW
jgi:beta-fructofuranosidase